MTRLLLLAVIHGYRMIPGRWRRTCLRTGPSCSAQALATVQAGAGPAAVLAIIGACTGIDGEGCRQWD